ncbi:unnamed protein product [Protopolystoma xenopodis]|uniref:Uncharacterized protein n=1 Tax=Protopolystoma xenopodis TaxID=117903 RepID=A0A448XLF4_9PLAT|nr:unnamed protein product [Protopolystoma xenopodis]
MPVLHKSTLNFFPQPLFLWSFFFYAGSSEPGGKQRSASALDGEQPSSTRAQKARAAIAAVAELIEPGPPPIPSSRSDRAFSSIQHGSEDGHLAANVTVAAVVNTPTSIFSSPYSAQSPELTAYSESGLAPIRQRQLPKPENSHFGKGDEHISAAATTSTENSKTRRNRIPEPSSTDGRTDDEIIKNGTRKEKKSGRLRRASVTDKYELLEIRSDKGGAEEGKTISIFYRSNLALKDIYELSLKCGFTI